MQVRQFHLPVALAVSLFTLTAVADPIVGKIGAGSGPGWQSSWLDLKSPTAFKKGEKLSIKVDGTAENVLVRLLQAGDPPDSPTGIEGRSRKVPGDKLPIITLERDHPNVGQISVHGGTSAWSTHLGANNGNVMIVSIDRAMK